MKTNYEELKIELLTWEAQDVVTASGFMGNDQGFGDPNTSDPAVFSAGE